MKRIFTISLVLILFQTESFYAQGIRCCCCPPKIHRQWSDSIFKYTIFLNDTNLIQVFNFKNGRSDMYKNNILIESYYDTIIDLKGSKKISYQDFNTQEKLNLILSDNTFFYTNVSLDRKFNSKNEIIRINEIIFLDGIEKKVKSYYFKKGRVSKIKVFPIKRRVLLKIYLYNQYFD